VFDPERDLDPSPGRFWLRLLTVALISAAGCIALFPSVSSFVVGDSDQRGCLAIKDGWHADKPAPSAEDLAVANAVMPAMPTREQAKDPEFMARWRVVWRAAQSSPAVVQANSRFNWAHGPGACVPESRHRLILSGLGLGGLLVIVGATAIGRRTRTNLRRSRAEHEDVDAGSVRNEVLTEV
jgi:hypothetical protein